MEGCEAIREEILFTEDMRVAPMVGYGVKEGRTRRAYLALVGRVRSTSMFLSKPRTGVGRSRIYTLKLGRSG